jgi:plastocyanin
MKIRCMTKREASLLTVLMIFASACSSSTEKQSKSYTVEIKQMKFVPDEIILHMGDTVVFVNQDLLTHDITEQSTKAWTSSPLPPNSSWSIVIEKTSDYYCSIHPVMKGQLVVK